MAQGDVTIFEEAALALLDGTHDLDTHVIKVAICDNTVAPVASVGSPALGLYTEVGAAGSYTAGGETLTISLSEVGGVVTFDATTNPTWLQNPSNDVDAYWGIIYNSTDVGNAAIAFVDLGGPVDMSNGDLTITWAGTGIFQLSIV